MRRTWWTPVRHLSSSSSKIVQIPSHMQGCSSQMLQRQSQQESENYCISCDHHRGIYPGMLSGILSDIYSDIHSDFHHLSSDIFSTWLVVSNIFYFPFHIWDVILPINMIICFKMVKTPPTSWHFVWHKKNLCTRELEPWPSWEFGKPDFWCSDAYSWRKHGQRGGVSIIMENHNFQWVNPL